MGCGADEKLVGDAVRRGAGAGMSRSYEETRGAELSPEVR